VDPSYKEEAVMEGRMTLTLNSHREICSVQKAGNPAISLDQLNYCTRIATVKVEELTAFIQSSLKAELQKPKLPYLQLVINNLKEKRNYYRYRRCS
jgi:exosome complex component RRP45